MWGGGDDAACGMDSYCRPPSGIVVRGVGYELGLSSLDMRKSELVGDVEPDQDGRSGGEDDTGCCGGCGVNGSLEPVKSATQSEEPVGVEGATVVPGDGELLSLTTVVSLKASCLMEASGRRLKEFAIVVKGLKEKPDIIVVTELGGFSGAAPIQPKMRGHLSLYGVASSQRPQ